MLLNVSYNNKEVIKKIDAAVGAPFNLLERIRLGGVGSPKLNIHQVSIQIHNLLILDNNANICHIELRPKGILIRFRSLLETYALVIPYYKLRVYKGEAEVYGFYIDAFFIKVRAKSNDRDIQKFIKKLLDQYIEAAPTRIEDL
ncbi:MAG: hypothetical protein RQ756_07660 [Flavobacteriaceae bacterium]|nr:hypothetical protein [Flavobacteriaceae bacterium]